MCHCKKIELEVILLYEISQTPKQMQRGGGMEGRRERQRQSVVTYKQK